MSTIPARLRRKRRTSIFLGLNITRRRQSSPLVRSSIYRSSDNLLSAKELAVSSRIIIVGYISRSSLQYVYQIIFYVGADFIDSAMRECMDVGYSTEHRHTYT